MTYHPDSIPRALDEAIRDLFGGIDHVNVQRIRWVTDNRGAHPVGIADDVYGVIVEVKGWSPSLHRAVMEYEADLSSIAEALPTKERRKKALSDMQRNDAVGVATLVALAMDAFGDDAKEQRARVEHAAQVGLHRPRTMRHPGSVSDGQRIAVGHLLIDRSAAEILRDLCGEGGDDPCPRRTIEHAVAVAHHRASTFDREVSVAASTIKRISLHSHLHGPTVDIVVPFAREGQVVGDLVVVDTQLPETVLAACVGRPLRDMIDAGPHFATRTVRSVRTWVGSTRVALEPDLVRVDEAFPPRRGRRTRP
jgi:hypothetical protein